MKPTLTLCFASELAASIVRNKAATPAIAKLRFELICLENRCCDSKAL
jgi:hypothetical protein